MFTSCFCVLVLSSIAFSLLSDFCFLFSCIWQFLPFHYLMFLWLVSLVCFYIICGQMHYACIYFSALRTMFTIYSVLFWFCLFGLHVLFVPSFACKSIRNMFQKLNPQNLLFLLFFPPFSISNKRLCTRSLPFNASGFLFVPFVFVTVTHRLLATFCLRQ